MLYLRIILLFGSIWSIFVFIGAIVYGEEVPWQNFIIWAVACTLFVASMGWLTN